MRIRTDDLLFIVSRTLIEKKCPNSILINSEQLKINDLVIGTEICTKTEEKTFNVITIYLDIDPIIMKQIVRLLRGGVIENTFNDPNDHNLLNTLLKKLKMEECYDLIENNDALITVPTIPIVPTNEINYAHNYNNNESNPLNDSPIDINSEIKNNIAKIFGVSKESKESKELNISSDIDSFTAFSSNVIDSINDSINHNTSENMTVCSKEKEKEKTRHTRHKTGEKKSKSKILSLDTTIEEDL